MRPAAQPVRARVPLARRARDIRRLRVERVHRQLHRRRPLHQLLLLPLAQHRRFRVHASRRPEVEPPAVRRAQLAVLRHVVVQVHVRLVRHEHPVRVHHRARQVQVVVLRERDRPAHVEHVQVDSGEHVRVVQLRHHQLALVHELHLRRHSRRASSAAGSPTPRPVLLAQVPPELRRTRRRDLHRPPVHHRHRPELVHQREPLDAHRRQVHAPGSLVRQPPLQVEPIRLDRARARHRAPHVRKPLQLQGAAFLHPRRCKQRRAVPARNQPPAHAHDTGPAQPRRVPARDRAAVRPQRRRRVR
mmetsp:Transcript_28010/g.32429  ORF Transcript_28010/g.32429 Transcript_28010/m.32429 type:complete len:302 (-) Transcript_28010:532-1437(-)